MFKNHPHLGRMHVTRLMLDLASGEFGSLVVTLQSDDCEHDRVFIEITNVNELVGAAEIVLGSLVKALMCGCKPTTPEAVELRITADVPREK